MFTKNTTWILWHIWHIGGISVCIFNSCHILKSFLFCDFNCQHFYWYEYKILVWCCSFALNSLKEILKCNTTSKRYTLLRIICFFNFTPFTTYFTTINYFIFLMTLCHKSGSLLKSHFEFIGLSPGTEMSNFWNYIFTNYYTSCPYQ